MATKKSEDKSALITSKTIFIKNQLSEISSVNEQFEQFAQSNNIANKIKQQMKMVLDELLNNTISYAFPDNADHKIEIQFECNGERLITRITDDGIPFNPFTAETPNTTLSIEDREIGGLGILLVKNIVDKAAYQRRINQNHLILIKDMNPRQSK